jgi:hypothetical protein
MAKGSRRIIIKSLVRTVVAVLTMSLSALSLADSAISIAPVKTLKIDRGLSVEGKACITVTNN